MLKKIVNTFTWTLIVTVLLHLSATAQQSKPSMAFPEDNLRFTLNDSSRIHALIRAGRSYKNADSSLHYLEYALRLSRENRYNEGIAWSLLSLSNCYAIRHDMAAAKEYLLQAYPYCIFSPKKSRLVQEWYRHQAFIFKSDGNVDSAVAVIRKMAPFVASLGDTSFLIRMYNDLGALLCDNGNYETAYPYMRKALDMNRHINEDRLVSLVNMAYFYSHKQQWDSVFLMASDAIRLSKSVNLPRFERSASLLLVQYYLHQQNEKTAGYYVQNAIRLIDSSALSGYLYIYRSLCMLYLHHGDHKRALTYGRTAVQSLEEKGSARRDLVMLYLQMAKAYDAIGEKDSAYTMLTKYIRLTDSIGLQERSKTVDRLEKQFQLSEKEKEIVLKGNQLLLQQHKVRSRNIWIAVIGGGLIAGLSLSGLLYSLYRGSKKEMRILHQQKEIDELRATMEGEEKERNRIAVELHDNIGGMLSTAVYSLDTLKNGQGDRIQSDSLKKIEDIITAVRNEIRKTAHTLMPDVLLRHSLPEAIRQYCSFIERDTGLQIDVQEQGSFDYLNKDVQLSLYRITQELIQNILKHARATQAMVQIHSGKDIVSLTVEDNGTGFDSNGRTEGRGILHIKNRLLVLSGRLSIDSEPGKGTSVYAEIQNDGSVT